MDCFDVTEQWADTSQGQVATKGRLILICVVLYSLMAWGCWTELRYRSAVELPAQFTVVGNTIRNSRHGSHELHRVRYTFHDPVTGRRHQNTVEVPPSQVPAGQHVMVQYLAGEFPESRLVIQARPTVVTVFHSMTALLALIGGGAIVCLSRDAHSQPRRGIRSFTPTRRRIEIT